MTEPTEAGATLLGIAPSQEIDETPISTEEIPADSPTEQEVAPTEPDVEPEAAELNWQTLMEASGADPTDVYSIELPAGAGEEIVTLGEAKDAAKAIKGLETQKAEHTVAMRDKENQVMQKLREAQQMLELVPEAQRDPNTVRQLQHQQQQHLQREQSMLLEALPGWSDPITAGTEQKQIHGLLRGYGFTDAEIGAIADHRAVKMMRDYAELKTIIDGTKDKQVRGGTKAAPKRRAKPQTKLAKIEAEFKAGRLSRSDAATATLLAGLERAQG